MPLYEYRCLKCEHVMEVLQKLSDPPLRRCKVCSGKVEKLISRTSFQLKGGGWFDQGYGRNSGKASSDGTKAKGGDSTSGSESSADASKTSKDKTSKTSKDKTSKPSK